MADQVQELQDALAAQSVKIDAVATGLTDLASDQKAAFDTLKAQIGNNPDLTPALNALAATFPRLDAIAAAIKTADDAAEGITGTHTEPPSNPA